MYMSIFQYLYINHFQNPISITRNEVMQISKIASPATYHKCIKELNTYGYFMYAPSFHPFKGSLVTLLDLTPETEDLPLNSVELLSNKVENNVHHFDLEIIPKMEEKAGLNLTDNQKGCPPNKVIHTIKRTGCEDLTNKRTGYPKNGVNHTIKRTGCEDLTIKRTGKNPKNEVIHTKNPSNGDNLTNKRTGYPQNEVIHIEKRENSKKVPTNNIKYLSIVKIKENYIKEKFIKKESLKEKDILKIKEEKVILKTDFSKKNNSEMKNENEIIFEKKETISVSTFTPSKIPSPLTLFGDVEMNNRKMKIPTIEEVSEHFMLKNYAPIEAEKFFNYFQSKGWLVGAKAKMKDWKAASRNWILNSKTFNQPKSLTPTSIASNLQVLKNKNYNEPL